MCAGRHARTPNPCAASAQGDVLEKTQRRCWQDSDLAALEQQDGDLSQVEVDKVFGLVRHIAPKVAPHDAVPGGIVLFVKLFFDESCDFKTGGGEKKKKDLPKKKKKAWGKWGVGLGFDAFVCETR